MALVPETQLIEVNWCEYDKKNDLIKRNDLILIGVILIIAIVAILYINLTKSEGGKVVVTVNGEIYKELPLAEDSTFTIGEKTGNYNILQIKDGVVTMIDANCPDKLCVKHRGIRYNHESIVCLPHKVVAEIQDGEDSDIDIITN